MMDLPSVKVGVIDIVATIVKAQGSTDKVNGLVVSCSAQPSVSAF